ncbi:MAG TPA: hypothetical protein PKA41_10740, partial [Verrucomicrobiota bacterium]|nr:hypothetical protein [Verrucomicrobiota bacterium]
MFKLFLGQIGFEGSTFLGPFAVVVIKDLGHCTPTNVFDQHRLFFGGRWPLVRIEWAERLDGLEILLKLLLRPAVAQTVGFRDAVAIEIAGRLVLVTARYSSDGSRMYFSRTIS